MSLAIGDVRARAPGAALEPPEPSRSAGLLGLGWVGMGQFVCLAIRLASNLVLTRLLAPEVYGLFGTALAIVSTLEWLSDLGIQPALIRHRSGGRPEYLGTGWWMGLTRGLILAAIAGSLAWPIALGFEQPSLAPVLLALALRPILGSLRSPNFPLVRRALNYRAVFLDEVIQTIIGVSTSVALAWLTPTPWAIVGGTLAGTAAGALFSYRICPIASRPTWDGEAAREIAHLGRQVFANTLVMVLWLNLDRLLGLKLLGEAEMGYYAVAWNLAAVAEGLLSRACDVYFSMLSRRGDPEAQLAWHRAACRRVAAGLMPLMAIGVLVGPRVIDLLYDPRYSGARIPFALLIARLMIRGLGQVQFQYLLARAEVRLATRAYAVALPVQAALLVPLVRAFGLPGLAMTGVVSTVVLTGAQTLFMERRGIRGRGPFALTLALMLVALLGVWSF